MSAIQPRLSIIYSLHFNTKHVIAKYCKFEVICYFSNDWTHKFKNSKGEENYCWLLIISIYLHQLAKSPDIFAKSFFLSIKRGTVIQASESSTELWKWRFICSWKLWLLWSSFLSPTSECIFSVGETGDTQIELITCSATCCSRESLMRMRKVAQTLPIVFYHQSSWELWEVWQQILLLQVDLHIGIALHISPQTLSYLSKFSCCIY